MLRAVEPAQACANRIMIHVDDIAKLPAHLATAWRRLRTATLSGNVHQVTVAEDELLAVHRDDEALRGALRSELRRALRVPVAREHERVRGDLAIAILAARRALRVNLDELLAGAVVYRSPATDDPWEPRRPARRAVAFPVRGALSHAG